MIIQARESIPFVHLQAGGEGLIESVQKTMARNIGLEVLKLYPMQFIPLPSTSPDTRMHATVHVFDEAGLHAERNDMIERGRKAGRREAEQEYKERLREAEYRVEGLDESLRRAQDNVSARVGEAFEAGRRVGQE